jgi:uncharacterized protein YjiS (DUF1127 family)
VSIGDVNHGAPKIHRVNMKFIIDALNSFFDNIAKARTAKELVNMTDSRLKDIGLSRFKLEQGASAHPWKIDTNAVVLSFSNTKVTSVAPLANKQEEKVAA